MNDSSDPLDPLEHDLYRAFSSRSTSIEPAAPPFETLGAPSTQPRRFLLVAASVALVAVGGLAFANLGGASDGGQGVADGEVLPAPTDGSYPVPADEEFWACTGPVDASADGPADESTDEGAPTYWRTCTPVSDLDTIASVTTTIVIDASAPPGAPDDDATATTSTVLDSSTPSICTVPGGCGTYTVAVGDNPTSVAEQFCVTATELAAANNWLSFEEFPQPGVDILVPPHADGDICPDADS